MSSLGTEWVEKQLRFMTVYADVLKALREADEFSCFSVSADMDFGCEFFDVRTALLHARPERTYLEETDLFNLKRSIGSVIAYIEAFTETTEEEAHGRKAREKDTGTPADAISDGTDASEERGGKNYRYPALAAMSEGVVTFPQIIQRIDAILNKYGKVKDTASPELVSIRHQIEVTVRSISHNLRAIISEAQNSGYIDRDVAPTLRDGRLVIPVAPALKRKIKGIVHDESATGKTVFIEPAAVVEANNRTRELRAAERREIIRLLQEVTALIRPHIPEILGSLHFLGHIDYLQALTQFSASFKAVIPQVRNEQRIDWAQAVHPLLQQSLLRHGGKMVPLDVSLGQDRRILIISGPNAGGKSVCLKTVGLLQYMLQCGMPVPVGERTKAGIFNDIFIDIGDEQSIENELSTYSSHLLNMKEMIRHADSRSLLLIDEFGGGTEPQIGGALAEAILHKFVRNRAFGIITTHYQNLKQYAEKSRAVVNGAMLYERAKMQPLFLLQVGNPGSSFAVEIARKTGIPEDVIQYASDIVGKDYILSDKYLQDIVRDKMYWENKRRNITARERQMEDTISKYEREMKDFQQERRLVMAQAKADAKQILESANAQIENTIRAIKEAQAEKEKTRQIRTEFTEFRQELERDTDEQDRIARKIAKIQRRQKRREEGEPRGKQRFAAEQQAAAAALHGAAGRTASSHTPAPQSAFTPGSYVRLKGQTTVGRIDSISGSTARVLFGMMFTQVPLKRLELSSKPQNEDTVSQAASFVSKDTRDAMYEKKLHFKPEIDIRGMHVDEALTAVSYFVDDSIQLEQAQVRILHGTGTGALRELVRNYLRTVAGVKRFRDEHVQFGGAGITVVEFE